MSIGALPTPVILPTVMPVEVRARELVWGMEPCDLHDGYWASQGVQIVRPGATIDRRGPQTFVLLRSDQAVLVDIRPLLRRATFIGGRGLRVRIKDRSEAVYREQVRRDAEGRLVRVERIYPRSASSVSRIVITSDPVLADRWAARQPGQERWADLAADGPRLPAVSAEGQQFDLGDASTATQFIRRLQRLWQLPGRLVPGIYELFPGVWVHETARLSDRIRLVGPLWIGAGQQIGEGEVRIGPGVMPDLQRCVRGAGIDWKALDAPSFPMIPSVRRRTMRQISKRLFDIAMSLAVLVATLPIYPIVMLLIYLEDGRPFFFAHTRQTVGGRPFPCYKFRTMVRNAEQIKASLQLQNACDGPQFYMPRDPRLLRIGGFLRRSQIDELPQFWNVLRGHMSVVGPRPSPDKENQFCPAWRESRLSVRPGVTGLWQVRRTRLPETDFQEWIRYDLEYVQRQSWRMDIWIILQTIRKVIAG